MALGVAEHGLEVDRVNALKPLEGPRSCGLLRHRGAVGVGRQGVVARQTNHTVDHLEVVRILDFVVELPLGQVWVQAFAGEAQQVCPPHLAAMFS